MSFPRAQQLTRGVTSCRGHQHRSKLQQHQQQQQQQWIVPDTETLPAVGQRPGSPSSTTTTTTTMLGLSQSGGLHTSSTDHRVAPSYHQGLNKSSLSGQRPPTVPVSQALQGRPVHRHTAVPISLSTARAAAAVATQHVSGSLLSTATLNFAVSIALFLQHDITQRYNIVGHATRGKSHYRLMGPC